MKPATTIMEDNREKIYWLMISTIALAVVLATLCFYVGLDNSVIKQRLETLESKVRTLQTENRYREKNMDDLLDLFRGLQDNDKRLASIIELRIQNDHETTELIHLLNQSRELSND